MRKNRNRKVTRQTVFKSGSMGVAALIVTAFLMLMAYWSVDSRCTAIAREIGKAEKALAAYEAEYVRETARWDEQKIPERLNEKLLRFGLEMRYAHQDQIVRMNADGRPKAGQIAVARARQRMREGVLAQATAASASQPIRPGAAAKKRGVRR